MHTLTTDTIAALLRQRATGSYADEAAVELLISHGTWLDRRDFLTACVDYDHDGQDPVVWVDWHAVPTFLEPRTVLGQRGPDPAPRRRAVRHRHRLPARRSAVRPRQPQQRPRRRRHRPRAPGGRAMRHGQAGPASWSAGAPARRGRARRQDRAAAPPRSWLAGPPVARPPAPAGATSAARRSSRERRSAPNAARRPTVLPTGMLAVVVETAGGDERLVVAERTPGGGWAATRNVPATPSAVRAVARQDHTRGGAA